MSDRQNALTQEPLTENEGSLLGVVSRMEPVTTYQLLKAFEQSPVASFNSSKGGVYKAVNRLKAAGLLRAEPTGGARNSEALSCTEAGLDALRTWVRELRPTHALIFDPWRTRVLSLDLLSRDQQIEWVVDAKNIIEEKMREVERYRDKATLPLSEIAYLDAMGSLSRKGSWLDRLLTVIVKDQP